jgi:hypothetical protein
MEKKTFTSSLKIFVQKPAVERGGAVGITPTLPSSHATLISGYSLKDDVTFILLLSVFSSEYHATGNLGKLIYICTYFPQNMAAAFPYNVYSLSHY